MKKWMRSLAGTGAAAVVGLCLMAASATAQVVDRDKTRPDTLKMQVSGEVVLDGVYRSQEITFFAPGFTQGVGSVSETTYEGHVALRVAAEMSDKVGAVVEFGTRRLDAGTINQFGGNSTAAAAGTDPATAPGLTVREAHILLGDFLMEGMNAQLGISTWGFNVREGRGGSMAFAPRRSQTITRNIDEFAGAGVDVTSEDIGGTRFGMANSPDELDPVGAVFTWSRERVQLDFVFLPAVLEGGPATADEALYAADLFYKLDDKGSRVGFVFAVHNVDRANGVMAPLGSGNGNGETSFYTVGGGGSLKMADGLEVFGEIYGQFGDAGKVTLATPDETIEMGGMAYQLGGRYNLPNNPNNFWVEVKYTYFSGDGDAVTDNDNTVDRFSAYEGVEDTLIVESMYYGLDIDSNYNALKISGGFSMNFMGRQNNLHVEAIFAHFTASEDYNFTGVTPGGGNEDTIGDEVDVKVKWDVSKQASLMTMVGFLMGSDILEESMGGTANNNAEDNAFLWTLGADLKF